MNKTKSGSKYMSEKKKNMNTEKSEKVESEIGPDFINPIDKDKVAENPGLLPYAHTIGGVPIKPEDLGRMKGRALSAMDEQTDMQMNQIKKQIELLAQQAQEIQRRRELSGLIYSAEISFEPLIGHIYFLYQRKNKKLLLSMVGPEQWGRTFPFEKFLAKIKLLSDHTWKILEEAESVENNL